MTATEKRCRKCSNVKPLDAFYAQPAGKFGRMSRCIDCIKIEHRAYKDRVTPTSVKELRARKQGLRSQGLKECPHCKEVKALSEFYVLSTGRLDGDCKRCNLQKHREWKAKNPQHMFDYVREYTSRPQVASKKREAKMQRAKESPRWVMQITLRHGLKRRPTENPATIDDLMQKWTDQGGLCAITGIRMTWRQGKVLPTSISLDRIDPEGGYSSDNLRLICHAINAFRGRMTDDQMFNMALAIVANMKRPKLRLVG